MSAILNRNMMHPLGIRTPSIFQLLTTLSFIQLGRALDLFYDRQIDTLGITEKLYCSNVTEYNVYPNSSQPTAWILPNLNVLYPNNVTAKYRIDDNGWTLAIYDIQSVDLGLYHCAMLTSADQWFLVKLGLNAKGPFFEDLWDIYRLNTIIGLSSTAVFLFIVISVYLLYQIQPAWFGDCMEGGADRDVRNHNGVEETGVQQQQQKLTSENEYKQPEMDRHNGRFDVSVTKDEMKTSWVENEAFDGDQITSL